jgi:hypothetical protein
MSAQLNLEFVLHETDNIKNSFVFNYPFNTWTMAILVNLMYVESLWLKMVNAKILR